MAGNVTAFNTVWTYDIYQSYINKKASRRALSLDGPHGDGLRDRAFGRRRLHGHALQQHHGYVAIGVRVCERAAVCDFPAGNVLEAHDRARCIHRAAGRHDRGGDSSWADVARGRLPGIKGGWLAEMHTYPSEMAQNFWTAIYAWTTCFVLTIVISLVTRPHKEEDLKGLVYSLTERPKEGHLSWYARPATLAIIVLGLTLALNIIFR